MNVSNLNDFVVTTVITSGLRIVVISVGTNGMEKMTPLQPHRPSLVIPWLVLARTIPNFVQWYVQVYGPIPDDDPGVDQTRYETLCSEYERWAKNG
jgi:hypothetical protein